MGVTLVTDMIGTAALLSGDPNKQRIQDAQWLEIFNLSVREMCKRWNILKLEWRDDLTTNHYFTYPDDMKVLTGVRVSSTPNDIASFQWVTPFQNEDDFRAATYQSWYTQTLPSRYYADPEVGYLVGRPEAAITDGLRVHGFGLPLRVATAAGALYEPHDLTADLCLNHMQILGKRVNKQYAEADREFAAWLEQGSRYEQMIEARSSDIRTSIRPASGRDPYSQMS